MARPRRARGLQLEKEFQAAGVWFYYAEGDLDMRNDPHRFVRDLLLVVSARRAREMERESMSGDAKLFRILDALVDGWCERRALGPLRLLLPAYPLVSGLTDEWYGLYDVLRAIRSQSASLTLTTKEIKQVSEAVVRLSQVLDRR